MSSDIAERLRADIRDLVVGGYEPRLQRDALVEIERLRRIEADVRDLTEAVALMTDMTGREAALWQALHAVLGAEREANEK